MAIVQDLIDTALLNINAIATGETPSSSERNDGLKALNRMLASWSARQVVCLGIFRETFTSSGADFATIGPGGTFNTTRPVKVRAVTSSYGGVAVGGLRPMTPEEFAAIPQKGASATVAERYLYDAKYPLASFYFWPKPQAGGAIEVYSEKPITEFAALTDPVDFPPGYERAITCGLSVELWPQYSRDEISPAVLLNAQDSIAAIAGLNAQTMAEPPQAAQQARATLEQGMPQ